NIGSETCFGMKPRSRTTRAPSNPFLTHGGRCETSIAARDRRPCSRGTVFCFRSKPKKKPAICIAGFRSFRPCRAGKFESRSDQITDERIAGGGLKDRCAERRCRRGADLVQAEVQVAVLLAAAHRSGVLAVARIDERVRGQRDIGLAGARTKTFDLPL